MARFNLLFLAFMALFLLTINASPTEKGTHFTIDQVPNPHHVSVSPEHLYAKALAKYGYSHPVLTTRSLSSSNGSVVNNPERDNRSWLSPITIGSDTMLVNIDTGSADLWVFSSVTDPGLRDNRPHYTPGPTAVEMKHLNFSIRYGDGSFAFGRVFTDKVTLGNVTVDVQAVEAATRMSHHFTEDRNNSGVFGFGFGSLNRVRPEKQKTFFENAMPHLSQPVFAANMKHNAPGSYDIGFIDRQKYAGELTYTPVNKTKGFWDVNLLGYQIGKNGSKIDAPFTASADTGTTFALLPAEIVKDYYDRIPGSEHYGGVAWYFPCNATIPDFGLRVTDNYTVYIPAEYIRYKQPSLKRNACFGGIQAARHFPILGSVFLKTQYTVFDYGQLRLGFAPQATQAKENKTMSDTCR